MKIYIKFHCSNCGKELTTTKDMDGELVECPSCGDLMDQLPRQAQQQTTAKASTQHSRPYSSKSAIKETKPCPFCGEPILSVAIKCKHCGSNLTEKPTPTIQQSETIGVVALILPVCSAMLAWFWLNGMPMIYDPGSKLAMISVITVIATSILVAIEANSVGAGSETDLNEEGKKREGAVTWFFACIILWIIMFPVWMVRRSKYGLKNLCSATVLVCLVFVCVTGLMHFAIEETKSDIRNSIRDTSRQMEQQNRCFNNLLMIDGGKQQAAVEMGWTDTTDCDVAANASSVNAYIKRGRPTCPAGGTYEYKTVVENPTCTIPGHELPHSGW